MGFCWQRDQLSYTPGCERETKGTASLEWSDVSGDVPHKNEDIHCSHILNKDRVFLEGFIFNKNTHFTKRGPRLLGKGGHRL